MYTLTYLQTSSSLIRVINAISDYERERLTTIMQRSPRTEAYARADRRAITEHSIEITAAFHAIGMHLDAYTGDDANNPYLALTSVGLRSAASMVGMLRATAQAEAEHLLGWSQADGVDVDTAIAWRLDGTALLGEDFYLYGKELEIDQAFYTARAETWS